MSVSISSSTPPSEANSVIGGGSGTQGEVRGQQGHVVVHIDDGEPEEPHS
ncbi:hypothetical protein ACP70R_021388 [Stipagrostis hirtigluma subsp. patula]